MNNKDKVRGLINSGVLYNNAGFFDQKIRLFFDKKEKVYYTDTPGLICECCNKPIKDIITYKATFGLKPEIHFCCESCLYKIENDLSREDGSRENEIMGIVIFSPDAKKHIPVFIKRPLLHRTTMSVTDIEKIQEKYKGDMPQIIDNTKLSFRPHVEDNDIQKRIEFRETMFDTENKRYLDGNMRLDERHKKDMMKSESEFEHCLDIIKSSKIIDDRIEYQEIKRLH